MSLCPLLCTILALFCPRPMYCIHSYEIYLSLAEASYTMSRIWTHLRLIIGTLVCSGALAPIMLFSRHVPGSSL